MEIEVTEHKRVSVFAVSGRIDGVTAGEFEAKLSNLGEGGTTNLILDLTGVEFLASAGLRVLVNARKALTGAGGTISIVPSQQVEETLKISGLDVLFELYADRETAVGAH